ncbi:class A beta-lactamase [Microlunatus soli]|uniref:Beta-lactamase n=1 Tax=Microlunatus soli TaxID=630515 RepID=A0A1H1WXJ7_9ACTN|nr:class A beta-lactamase [Microlunatus soli]SDT01877.1 beta-lactamase class A [Microlunatus soli]
MTTSTTLTRRGLLGLAAGTGLTLATGGLATADPIRTGHGDLARLEATYRTRLGVYAFNVRTGRTLCHRPNERFPIASVFKTLAAAAILRDHDRHGEVLASRRYWTAEEVVDASPVTEKHVADGLTVAELCEAAITQSDNTAANEMLKIIGGPRGLTRFARSIGDRATRLDRWETELNSAIPGDLRDTTTPQAIAASYAELALGHVLIRRDRHQLLDWLLHNQTSAERFGAGVPDGWPLADKTGSPAYGGLNDVGITWTPAGTPIVMAGLSVTDRPDAVIDPALMADVARLCCAELG